MNNLQRECYIYCSHSMHVYGFRELTSLAAYETEMQVQVQPRQLLPEMLVAPSTPHNVVRYCSQQQTRRARAPHR
jgi:hypothetical protein